MRELEKAFRSSVDDFPELRASRGEGPDENPAFSLPVVEPRRAAYGFTVG